MAKADDDDRGPGSDADTASPDGGDAAQTEKPKGKGGLIGMIVSLLIVTLLGGGLGAGLGYMLAGSVEQMVIEKQKAEGDKPPPKTLKYTGDLILQPVEAVITNLANPKDIWVRLEASIVFVNGSIENPAVTAAEIRQDILSYLRTVSIDQLEGPSALQHLREDLNERVALRTNGQVDELIIESLVVQ